MVDLDTVRRINNLEKRVDDLVFPEEYLEAVTAFLSLPGLRGFWPLNLFSHSGATYDLGVFSQDLTYNGNGTYGYTSPYTYFNFDGTGDYFNRADNVYLDITGTETYVASARRGLMMGGWFNFDDVSRTEDLMGKRSGGGDFSYYLRNIASFPKFFISNDGTTTTTVTSTVSLTNDTWYFIWCGYDPSSVMDIFIDNVRTRQTTSIPASIYNGAGDFRIGARNGGNNPFDGQALFCALCCTYPSSDIPLALFEKTRGIFGK